MPCVFKLFMPTAQAFRGSMTFHHRCLKGVCLVENESGRSTSKVMQLANHSVSYGLFQINNKNWCRKGRKGGICNIKCEDFLNDEISDDSRCAMQIFNRHGFQAWPGWVNKCRGRTLPDVSRC
ncbi:PREDICTED: lysozyme c-1 isoform X2 [Bactrocera latifrons]|uniref:lysozyme n=1 Tax=Bactrocera latifrons TaxID=174628 RepID=A0A0K8W258_BACLA|nr:PREDICTED: lysozyme c-1 isoform X2 [Bactrocera latifrons]